MSKTVYYRYALQKDVPKWEKEGWRVVALARNIPFAFMFRHLLPGHITVIMERGYGDSGEDPDRE